MFEIDLNELLMQKILEQGGNIEDFAALDTLITKYSELSGMPEEGIALIIIDCVDSGFSKEKVEKQLRVYDSKRTNSIAA